MVSQQILCTFAVGYRTRMKKADFWLPLADAWSGSSQAFWRKRWLCCPSEQGKLCPMKSLEPLGSVLKGCEKQGEHLQQESAFWQQEVTGTKTFPSYKMGYVEFTSTQKKSMNCLTESKIKEKDSP